MKATVPTAVSTMFLEQRKDKYTQENQLQQQKENPVTI